MLNPEDNSVNTGLEPELGGIWRDNPDRTGFEPELGGQVRQKGVYVDEVICIGCKNCVHVASNTFYIESEYGRARVFNQNGNTEELIQEYLAAIGIITSQKIVYPSENQLKPWPG